MDTARRARPKGVRRSSPVLGLLAVCVLAVLGLLGTVALGAAGGPVGRWFGHDGNRMRPALPADAASAPLARPEPAPSGVGGYRVLEREDDGSGRPVRWDPCRPIHYVIRRSGAPVGGQLAINQAIAEMEQVTGLRFSFDGDTREAPRPNRPTIDRARYGRRWAPVLIAWTNPKEYPAIHGYAGLGGPDTVGGNTRGHRRYVSGVVLLNRDHLAQVVRWADGQGRLDAVVLHEFGHLVGLDHVPDPTQLMYKQPTAHAQPLGDGDRRGLAVLSGGPCYRDF